MQDSLSTINIFELKVSLMPITIMRIKRANIHHIQQEMHHRMTQAPMLFRNIMMVVDLSQCQDMITRDFLDNLIEFLQQQNIIFSGLQNPTPEQRSIAAAAGIPLFNLQENIPSQHDQLNKRLPTLILRTHIRSGQHIQAHSRDLIIFGSVSQGAEVMADGNIFIYGSLRGKALAGISGDKTTCIYCKKLDAELVAIAGHYRLSHNMPPIQTKDLIQIRVNTDELLFEEIG